MIFRLSDELIFPDPALAEEDGLLAVGGDLRIQRLLLAYANGIFPWFNEDEGPILWFSPHERCVIFPERINISNSMQRVIASGKFKITENQAFEEVISACSSIPRMGQNGTWITPEMKKAYLALHRNGAAKSIEAWENGRLAGGLYGVVVNDIFCGESMFSSVSNASKAALIWLCTTGKYRLIDCQLQNPHLLSLGAEIISRECYLGILNTAN